MIIETSPEKFHVYWRTIDFPLERFRPFQKELAAVMGSCPNVTNLARVMRVPGFLHHKGEPFLSKVIRIPSDGPARAETLEEALSTTAREFKIEVPKIPLAPIIPAGTADSLSLKTLRRIDGLVGWVAAARPGKRNNSLFRAACLLAELAAPAWAWELLLEAARQCGLPEREAQATIVSAMGRVAA